MKIIDSKAVRVNNGNNRVEVTLSKKILIALQVTDHDTLLFFENEDGEIIIKSKNKIKES